MQSACGVLHRSSVTCPALPYFSTAAHTVRFSGKSSLKIAFWFSLQFSSETFLILTRIQRDMIINVYRSSREAPVIFVRCNESWISTGFRKILKYKISRKSVQWEPSCSMLLDGHDVANSCFSQFYERARRKGLKFHVVGLRI